MLNKINMIKITKPDNPSHQKEFTYDGVFGEDSTQQQVYDDAAFSLIESVLEGYNGKFGLRSSFLLLPGILAPQSARNLTVLGQIGIPRRREN